MVAVACASAAATDGSVAAARTKNTVTMEQYAAILGGKVRQRQASYRNEQGRRRAGRPARQRQAAASLAIYI
eukprot:COSAG06_NODE_576_length_14051_cov_5.354644_2_plen_72_part_00